MALRAYAWSHAAHAPDVNQNRSLLQMLVFTQNIDVLETKKK